MKLGIAIQACILILNLGLDSYRDWIEIIVYPDEFMPRQEYRNEYGLVQTDHHAYSGQAWLRGPVILSWASVETAWKPDGTNVVIHEFAHKLDMLNGDANGFPVLHAGMSRQQWAQTFTHAYEDLCRRARHGEITTLDTYACESPAEFFAVVSESFFEFPEALAAEYPEVYDQLAMFYRQDPASKHLPDARRVG
jgi:Mlc titration factor MtfA (ptsG expression regulator)